MPPSLPLGAAILGVLFITGGTLHFLYPGAYAAVVPPFLPSPRLLVYISGAFEILGGIGVLIPATRRPAGWGLILLLIAVFPANVYMATHYASIEGIPAWPIAYWARLPLQLVLIAWVWWAALRSV